MKFFIALLLCCTTVLANEDKVVAAYFIEWGIYKRNYQIKDVPADSLTHLIYAFAKVTPEGRVTTFDPHAALEKKFPGDKKDEALCGNFKQLKLLKKKHPHLKTLIAIGGGTLSGPFSSIAASPALRKTFVASAIEFMKKYGFDGIDIDWEYPVSGGSCGGRPEDKQNCTQLMRDLRLALDRLGKIEKRHYYLTMASPAGGMMKNIELAKVSSYIDWYNLMAYDYHNGEENQTHHQAALYANPKDQNKVAAKLYNVDYTVTTYLKSGVSPDKIVLGLPLFSHIWTGVPSKYNGLFQQVTPKGKSEKIIGYNALWTMIHASPDKFLVCKDPHAKSVWVYNPTLDGGTFITYESKNTMKNKVKYVKKKNLRGVMFWELSGDLKKGPDRLVPCISKCLLPN